MSLFVSLLSSRLAWWFQWHYLKAIQMVHKSYPPARLRKSSHQTALIRELQTSWIKSIPAQGSFSIAESVFGHLVDDLEVTVAGSNLGERMTNAKALSNPAMHGDRIAYLKHATLAAMYSKLSIEVPGKNPLATGEKRWHEAEALCKRTNRRLKHFRMFDHATRPLPKRLGVHEIFHLARRKIANWLSDYEPDDMLEYTRHGPGGVASADPDKKLSRPYTTPFFKFSTPGSVTQGAYFYYLRAVAKSDTWIRALAQEVILQETGQRDSDPNLSVMSYENRLFLADSVVEIARGSGLGFVPKNADTFRAICSEPAGNVYCQLGVGRLFRDALRKAGCNLNSQARNQELAEQGSIEWKLSTPFKAITIDLKMASDCLCVELVRELFEPKWFDLLDSLRCRETKYQGKWLRTEKFSSMGNGFTFELETMVFLAISQAVSDLNGTTEWYSDTFGPQYKYGELSVYGDDIIVPESCAASTISALKYCGFHTNLEKTFTSGPFRESCGRDFYNGHPVRAAYNDSSLSQVKDVVKLLNVVKHNSELLMKAGAKPLTNTFNYVSDFLSVIAPTVFTHLRSTDRTLGGSHIWCEPDELHRSKLVTWDADVFAFTQPQMRTPLIKVDLKDLGRTRPNAHFRVLQALYGLGQSEPTETSDVSEEWEEKLQSNPFRAGLCSGASGYDVYVPSLACGGKISFVHRCESMSGTALALVGLVEDRSNPEPVYRSYNRIRALKKLG